ncbi:conserved hypothetical protein [Denitrovibrio acetiphilus DSM 12809]|uniref:DUF3450 domain-containing protein n=1 Tax=Denitrovibrio acetiphilus (strain DSM 12809 / NBRC 114555 / N2460) TaxID=522772 RepID=D4H8M9_DENA2|nr:DUF3450 domain-containing protein [Denitrovibrio acetiphilus]ADD68378.1 conserved hypothetical protein [Denitrovibrio acetiphilus DSM 12809]
MKLITVLFLTIFAVTGSFAAELTNLNKTFKSEVDKQSELNSKNVKFQGEKAGNEEKIREMNSQKVWLEKRIEQYERYIVTIRENIEELKRKKDELAKIAEELEPYLDETVDRLNGFVAEDIPFLEEERRARLNMLRTSLADYKLSAGEKLRRVLEALQVESEYGKSIESRVTELEIDGSMLTAEVIRFGRLGYYYMTPDKKRYGYYSYNEQKWIDMEEKYKSELVKAVEIADRKRVMEVIYLPVSAKGVQNVK